jgi:hypothetical protein
MDECCNGGNLFICERYKVVEVVIFMERSDQVLGLGGSPSIRPRKRLGPWKMISIIPFIMKTHFGIDNVCWVRPFSMHWPFLHAPLNPKSGKITQITPAKFSLKTWPE